MTEEDSEADGPVEGGEEDFDPEDDGRESRGEDGGKEIKTTALRERMNTLSSRSAAKEVENMGSDENSTRSRRKW